MSRSIIILALVMFGMFACVAVVYREEIQDIQACTSRPQVPALPDRGDLAE